MAPGTTTKTPTAAVILIGNEVLSGRTQDKNLVFLGRRLGELGIDVVEARVVPDIEAVIAGAVNELRARCDYVFTTGGIGPTHDDITMSSIAVAFGVPVIEDPRALELLLEYYGEDELTDPRRKMASVPRGARLVENPLSAAPGYRIGNVFVFAGIPSIMQAMFETITPELTGGPPLKSESIVLDRRESEIAVALAAIQDAFPALSLGSYPNLNDGKVVTQVVVRGTDPDLVAAAAERVRAELTV